VSGKWQELWTPYRFARSRARGQRVSSGCIRLTNEDISDLYTRVQVGTRVVVLPGRPPATANAGPVGSQAEQNEPPQPYNPLAPRR